MLETIIKTLIFIAAAFAGVIYYKKTKSEKHNVIRVLIAVMLLVMLLSYLIPGSMVDYNYGTVNDDVVIPMNLAGLFTSFSTALNLSISMILYIGIIAIFYAILKKSGKYEDVVNTIAYKFRNNKSLFIVLTIFILGLVSIFTGEIVVMLAFVPLLISVIRRLGYSKETSIVSTVGAILLGQAGTIYANYMNNALKMEYTENILIKVIISAIVLVFLIAFVLLFNKKPVVEKELTKPNNKKVLPIFITFGVVFVILIMGFIPWQTFFGFKGFEEFLTSIRKTEFMGVSVFDAFIGNSSTTAPFGTWQLINAGVLFIFVDLILAIIYKVFSIETLIDGVKKAAPYMAITVLSYIIVVLVMNSGIFYTLTMGLTKAAVNIFTVGTTAIISALSVSEYTYASNFSLVAISSSKYFSQSPENLKLISIAFQSIYNLFLIISPVSLLLLFGLQFNNVKFKDWIKYIYKFFIVLFVTVLIIIKIMLEGFDIVGIIALSLLVVAIILIILMKLAFSKKIVLKVVEDEPVKESKAVVKTAEEVVEKPVVKKVSSKKPATKKTTNKKTTKK
ncbi:MAG: hypothetical protein IJH20_02880 [Bacilli bacterium]|nr:hypothetical protein [Bacilli bacterium]